MRGTKTQTRRATEGTGKKPLDIDRAFQLIRAAIRDDRPAAMFELADDGFNSVFELLLACIISIRTRDETTVPASRKLFERARTPEAVARMSVEEIDDAIQASTFHEPKARQIRAIAKRTAEEFGGTLPCDEEALRSFSGVGPKCAHLVLGIACGKKAISVDIHVHRVTNRWGYVQAPTPERTMARLEQVLPKKDWIEINRLLVPFGKHICTGELPKCSTCPVLEMCQQVGVGTHR
jgi:endonuclease-3